MGKKRYQALGQKGATLWMTGLSVRLATILHRTGRMVCNAPLCRGACLALWFALLALQGAGKTTICKALEKELLFVNSKNVYNIDGDNLRTG